MNPRLFIDLKKIEANARLLADLCRRHGIEPVGVTKATCGDPQVARAMLAGGFTMLGESRLKMPAACGLGLPLPSSSCGCPCPARRRRWSGYSSAA